LLKIRGEASGDCELELWGVPHRTALLEEALDLPVRIEVVVAARSGPARLLAARA
jgi:hypothetical protein